MKPNFHFATHIAAQIRDYGPVHGFWMFVGKRLNKVLKSFSLNNWSGGKLEVSMMRAFYRNVRLHEIVSYTTALRIQLFTCLTAPTDIHYR